MKTTEEIWLLLLILWYELKIVHNQRKLKIAMYDEENAISEERVKKSQERIVKHTVRLIELNEIKNNLLREFYRED